jgi:CHAT domain-containing protein
VKPLPGTREEANAMAQLFGRDATVYFGEQATEERFKTLDNDVRYIHFAVSSLLDDCDPFNSGLALAIPEPPVTGRDNGLLQVWEIYDGVRINAYLVTLSHSETAPRNDIGGEGLLGLMGAFQNAGARSVLASLWNVKAESTAHLMQVFYRNLKAGYAKDESLRAVQADLIRRGDAIAHPFYWAPFELAGDWK